MEAITVGTMVDLEGFDAQYGALFDDLAALARALGAGPDAEDVAQEACWRLEATFASCAIPTD